MASLTEGITEITNPLDSLDTGSCVSVCRTLGAKIEEQIIESVNNVKTVKWIINGISPVQTPETPIHCDAGNSGTTFYLGLAAAALGKRQVFFNGDEQLGSRDAGPLLEALEGLGIKVTSANGCTPISVMGPWKGGRVSLPCQTSQYLSAILLAAPLAPERTITEIDVPFLNEKPYIDMTLSYLKMQNIRFEMAEDYSWFKIPGGAAYKPLNGPVPGDFSSAAFPACAAVSCANRAAGDQFNKLLILTGLDPDDTQGDKVFFQMLEKTGCKIKWEKNSGEWNLELSGNGRLKGGVFDLNACPDLLPPMAVIGSLAEGTTSLVNAAHARLKETDRIAVMAAELGKMGVQIKELPDGLEIKGQGKIRGGKADGRKDHRVIMALACAALAAENGVEIADAEYAAITYPGFLDLLEAEFLE